VVVVEIGGGEDLHRVDIRIGQHGVQLGVGGGHGPGLGGSSGPALDGIADGHHVAPFVVEVARHIEFGDIAGPDNGDAGSVDRC
jgi:hypothetical protein